MIISLSLSLLHTVNYNGSMGFGQDAITSLLGKVGTLDIQDTQVKQVLLLATVLYIML